MKVFEALAAALREHRVEVVFGLLGNANLRYVPAFGAAGGRFVPVVHEGGAVGMADAYARLTGRVGVASVTHGPALTNAMTFLAEAVRARTPLVLITGDPPPVPTHFHWVDIAAVAGAAGACYERVHGPGTVVSDLDRAMRRALSERCPVVLNAPLALMEEDTAEPARAVLPPRPASVVTPAPGPGAVADAADLLRTVRRPNVLAGRGAVRSGARDELVALAGRLGAVLATTVQAKEYFAGHPDDLGIFGNVAYGASRAVIEESDGVVAFGASLNMWTTGSGRFTAGKRVVHVDVDPVRIGSFTAADVGIVADARLTAAAIGVALDDRGHEPAPGWTAGVRDRMADGGREFADRGGPDTVDVRSAMIRLDAVLPRQRVLVNDIGRFLVGVWPHLRVADPTDLVSMGEFGSVGLAVPAAVGAAIARPEQMVVALAGDGGLMMHLGELSTAVRERLPLLVVVLNDGAYGAEHYKLKDVGVDVRYAMNAWPDLAALAVAIGARGTTVRKLDDIDALAEIADDLDGPFLVDVRLDPDVNLM